MQKKIEKNIIKSEEPTVVDEPLATEDKPTVEEINAKRSNEHPEWKMMNAALKPLKKVCLKFVREALDSDDSEAQLQKLQTIVDTAVKNITRLQNVTSLTSQVAQMTVEEKEILKSLLA